MIPNNIIKKAIKEANRSKVRRGKVGAVLFNNSGHVICSAHNHPYYGHGNKFTIHAEEALINKLEKINALYRYGENLNVLVVRSRRGLNMLGNSKPCNNCARLLSNYSFDIYYSNEDGIIEEEER